MSRRPLRALLQLLVIDLGRALAAATRALADRIKGNGWRVYAMPRRVARTVTCGKETRSQP
eukprot:2818019-Karenia_brevis.AAC.1